MEKKYLNIEKMPKRKLEENYLKMKEKIYVFGHQKPDTDTICSSIVLANLEQALGHEATAYKLGNVNKETAYAIKMSNVIFYNQPFLLADIGVEYAPQSFRYVEL